MHSTFSELICFVFRITTGAKVALYNCENVIHAFGQLTCYRCENVVGNVILAQDMEAHFYHTRLARLVSRSLPDGSTVDDLILNLTVNNNSYSNLNPNAAEFVPQGHGLVSPTFNDVQASITEQDQEVITRMVDELLLDNSLSDVQRSLEFLLRTETPPPSYDDTVSQDN